LKSLTTEKVIFALIALGTFLLAPLLTTEFLNGNTLPVVLIFGLGLIFAFRDQCWILIPLCLPLTGSLNILPIKFSPLELSILLALGYVLLQIIFTERRLIRLGPKELYLPPSFDRLYPALSLGKWWRLRLEYVWRPKQWGPSFFFHSSRHGRPTRPSLLPARKVPLAIPGPAFVSPGLSD
jgi:hypothetical protein